MGLAAGPGPAVDRLAEDSGRYGSGVGLCSTQGGCAPLLPPAVLHDRGAAPP